MKSNSKYRMDKGEARECKEEVYFSLTVYCMGREQFCASCENTDYIKANGCATTSYLSLGELLQ